MTAIYVATATKREPGPGLAVVWTDHRDGRKVRHPIEVARTSGPRLELQAALYAAETAPTDGRVTICVLSDYVHNGVTKWLPGWAAKGWKTKDGRELKNADLWKRMLALSDRKIIWFKDDPARPSDDLMKIAVEEVRDWRAEGKSGIPPWEDVDDVNDAPPPEEPPPPREIPSNYGVW